MACLLLEQMCADLAINMDNPHRSMFLKVVSSGSLSSSRIAYPTQLLSVIFQHFQAISFRRCPLEESRLVRLLLDMTAMAATCDALAMDNCVQTLVKHLDKECDTKSFNKFIDLLSSESMALEMLNYAFMSYFRVAALPGESWSPMHRISYRLPPNATKTAFFVRHLRPQSKKEDPDTWHDVVCMLAKLVQRTVSAYSRRMCHANCISQSSAASLDSEFPHTLLVASARCDVADIGNACQALKTYLETKLPRPSATDILNDADDKMDCSGDSSDGESDSNSNRSGYTRVALLSMIYMDLDLIEALVAFSVGSGSP
ncbi:hypothetical protein H4S07_000847 [Coemansia furcata]|uniref:Uncharacterized protein n=1 Tax=Coemansia furcata TaxID=417177 RepID=A0ACC1LPZ2_9FUNG|nr:hypothetical protein H4S07_000847 [Coemansia furcata]